MNLNLISTLERNFNYNVRKIWEANSLIDRALFLFKSPKMDYWQENVDMLIADLEKYKKYDMPESLIIDGKDLVEIGKFGEDKK